MNDLDRHTRKRGSLKASLTYFIKFVEQIKNELSSDNQNVLSDTDQIQLQDRLSRIENVYHEFNELQNNIEDNVSLADLDEQYTERSLFDESYFSITAIAKNILQKFMHKEFKFRWG